METPVAGNKVEQDTTDDSPIVIKNVSDDNVQPKRKVCMISSLASILVIILSLLGVAIYFIVVTPQMSKDLKSTPESGYLYITDLNNLLPHKQCEKMTVEEFKNLTSVIITMKQYGMRSIAMYCEKMSSANGMVDALMPPFKEMLTKLNQVGVSVGLVISQTQFKEKKFLDQVKTLPFMAFYHYIQSMDDIDTAGIKAFGSEFSTDKTLLLSRTNNLILTGEDYAYVGKVKTLFGNDIKGVVVSVKSIKDQTAYTYPSDLYMIFMPNALTLPNPGWPTLDADGLLQQNMLVIRSIFASNASANFFDNKIPLTSVKEDFSAKIQEDKDLLNYLTFLRDFAAKKEKNKLWESVKPELHVKTVITADNSATAYSLGLIKEKNTDFTHLLLLQNVKDAATTHNFTYSLNSFGVAQNAKAQVIVSYPQPYPSIKSIVATDNITLGTGESIVLAIYNDEKSKEITVFSPTWPIPVPPPS